MMASMPESSVNVKLPVYAIATGAEGLRRRGTAESKSLRVAPAKRMLAVGKLP